MSISIDNEQFKRACHSAGLWFVGMYMEKILLNATELEDKLYKDKFIEEIYCSSDNTFDKNLSGTRTRVNSVYRIVRANRVKEALELVTKSSRLEKENPKAIIVAKELLSKIESGLINI